jgi:hypothetical protein
VTEYSNKDIGDESQFHEHDSAQILFVVTCPTRERAEIAMLSRSPIRAGTSGICACFRLFPAAAPGEVPSYATIGGSDSNLTSPAACATLLRMRHSGHHPHKAGPRTPLPASHASAVSLRSCRVTFDARIIPRKRGCCPRKCEGHSPSSRLLDTDSNCWVGNESLACDQ